MLLGGSWNQLKDLQLTFLNLMNKVEHLDIDRDVNYVMLLLIS